MSMQEWAKKEIEIACARERGYNPEYEDRMDLDKDRKEALKNEV